MTRVPGQVAAAERGATRIADRVVEKIAARAAREALSGEVPETAGAPKVSVSVSAEASTARVRVLLELGFPSDIAGQCGAVRRQVTERVRTLAGMEVPEVSVRIERLHAEAARHGTQGRTR